jgi:hypothetical protein
MDWQSPDQPYKQSRKDAVTTHARKSTTKHALLAYYTTKEILIPWCSRSKDGGGWGTYRNEDSKLMSADRLVTDPMEVNCEHCIERMILWDKRQGRKSPYPMVCYEQNKKAA